MRLDQHDDTRISQNSNPHCRPLIAPALALDRTESVANHDQDDELLIFRLVSALFISSRERTNDLPRSRCAVPVGTVRRRGLGATRGDG